MGLIDQHEIRIVLDPAGMPLAASWTTVLTSGSYRTGVVTPGPFDTPVEVLEACLGRLDKQLSLW